MKAPALHPNALYTQHGPEEPALVAMAVRQWRKCFDSSRELGCTGRLEEAGGLRDRKGIPVEEVAFPVLVGDLPHVAGWPRTLGRPTVRSGRVYSRAATRGSSIGALQSSARTQVKTTQVAVGLAPVCLNSGMILPTPQGRIDLFGIGTIW